MPAIVASAIRYIIITAVQLGIFEFISAFILPWINKAIAEIIKVFNVSDETAQDIMSNWLIQGFESVGIFAAVMATKMPVKVAERLGFTSKGFKKRTLKPEVEAKIKNVEVKKTLDIAPKKILTMAEATTAVETAKISKLGFKPAYDLLIKTVGVTFMGFMAVGNWIDFGNWNNGAYQKSMQKFISWITFGALVPDEDYRKSLTVSDAIFTKVYNTFKLGGALGIQDPYKGVDVPFSRDNLLDLTDQVGKTLLLTNGSASAKNVLEATLPMIIFNTTADVDNAVLKEGGAITTKTTIVSTPQITKVFTGIVSQGVVGQGLVFTARPDDMIESADELRSAASNNLAPFLNTLLGKIVYEVKVVSSIITKDGFKQTGTTQRIQTGTYSNGTPKYKTVTNKFATLVVYALTDKGSRAKLTTIVLGPVDSAKLTIGQNDLQALQNELPALVTTTDINDITGIKTNTPVEVTPTQQITPTQPIVQREQYDRTRSVPITPENIEYFRGLGYKIEDPTHTGLNIVGYAPIKTNDTTSVPATVTSVTTNAPTQTTSGSGATTLFEWYQAQGQTLPSVSERSVIYEGLGLGPRSYYTGTSEQNTKLLSALKAR